MTATFVNLAVFICGAVVMSFEILGSRVLAPNFGNTIFVWGSLISIFLTGLSAGYYLGGRFADRQPSTKKLAVIIIAPAFMLVLFPLYQKAVCDWIFLLDVGDRSGPLAASLALFLVPSIFFGAVSPYAVKLRICSLGSVGHTVGNLYALSTIGSIAGTLATSFYLIAVAGVNALILSQGILLLLVSLPLLLMDTRCEIEE